MCHSPRAGVWGGGLVLPHFWTLLDPGTPFGTQIMFILIVVQSLVSKVCRFQHGRRRHAASPSIDPLLTIDFCLSCSVFRFRARAAPEELEGRHLHRTSVTECRKSEKPLCNSGREDCICQRQSTLALGEDATPTSGHPDSVKKDTIGFEMRSTNLRAEVQGMPFL